MLSLCRNWGIFPFAKRCTTTKNPDSLLTILKSLQFILFCVRKMILDQIVVRISERRFFWWRCAFHWRGEHCYLCKFWLWYYFLAWNSYKNQTDQPRTELHFQILWKTPMHSQERQHNCFVDEQHSSNIFLNPYNLWDMVPAALMSCSRTNDTYSTFNQYP